MRLYQNQHRPLPLLSVCILVLLTLSLTGCRSGIFNPLSKDSWKRPDMSGLAFWKKGDSDSIPPPPARHFSPSNDGVAIAAAETKKKSGETDVQSTFNELIASSNGKKSSPASSTQPIRSPYSLDRPATMPQTTPKTSPHSFDASLASGTTENRDFDPAVKQAQLDFNAALAGSQTAIKNSIPTTNSTASQLAANFKNDFQAPTASSPSERKIDLTSNSFAAAGADIKRGLYDATGNLTSGFKQSATEVKTAANQFQKSVTEVGNKEMGNVQAEIATAQAEIAQLKQQLLASQQAATAAAVAKTNQAVEQKTNQALDMARAAAQQPLARLAQANQALSNFSSTGSAGNFSPLDNSPTNTGDSAPNNQLRGGSFHGFSNAPEPPQATGQSQNQYPATSHGSYSPQSNQFSSNGISGDLSGGEVTPASHVSEIDIPGSVLRGSGSYAPGSVNQLIPSTMK